MCNTNPRQTFFPLFLGTILEPLGITILAIALRGDNLKLIYGMLALTGIGTGIRLMPGTLHGVGYFPTQVSSIVSLMSLANSLGGAISTTLLLNIFNNTIRTSSTDIGGSSTSGSSIEAIAALPPALQAAFRSDARRGIVLGFFALSAFAWLGCVAMMGLGNVKIGQGVEGEEGKRDDEVIEGSYIVSLIMGTKDKHRPFSNSSEEGRRGFVEA
jgi:hypothetical protein